MMHWSARYVGTPFADRGRSIAGCDCWGLAFVVFAAELGIAIPDYAQEYDGPADLASLGPLIGGERLARPWRAVTGVPRAFDIAIFRRGRIDSHIGIVVNSRQMLHVARGDCGKIEAFADRPWNVRLSGIVRHEELCDA